MLSFLLKKGIHFKKLYSYNYKIYKEPVTFFLKFYVLYQFDFQPLNPAEVFKLNNLMRFNFIMPEIFEKNFIKFIF